MSVLPAECGQGDRCVHLKDKHKKIDPELRELELENERLKRIIAKQALEIEVKTELLKKTPIGQKKR